MDSEFKDRILNVKRREVFLDLLCILTLASTMVFISDITFLEATFSCFFRHSVTTLDTVRTKSLSDGR